MKMDNIPYKPHSYEIEELEKLSARMSSMKPLPRAASPEAQEFGHENWMEYHRQIKALQFNVMQIALLALPPDVARAYKACSKQVERLLNLKDLVKELQLFKELQQNGGEEITRE